MLAEATIESIPIHRDLPQPGGPARHLGLDKGYDYDHTRAMVAEVGFTAHVRTRGDEARELKKKARRWMVERKHSWMNRFRRLPIQSEKKAENYLGLLHLVCYWITYWAAGLLR